MTDQPQPADRLTQIERRHNSAADRTYWPSWQDVSWLTAEARRLGAELEQCRRERDELQKIADVAKEHIEHRELAYHLHNALAALDHEPSSAPGEQERNPT